MKKILSVFLVLILVFTMTACSSDKGKDNNEQADPLKVGLVLSTGGLGDKNFNDMSYAGVLQAQEDFGVEFDYVEPKSVSEFVSQHRMFAETEEYDLIIAVGNDQTEAVIEVSKDFPQQKISIIDAGNPSLDLPNISAVSTKWAEQTFLSGVIAGLGTLSDMEKANEENVIGVVLGMDLPNLREGVAGFESGAKYVNPDVEVLKATVGSFNDPGKSKEIALSMYNRGADFVQHIAGASGLGVFNATKEANRYAIGVGGNQNAEEPDYIVATSIRNVNEMVYNEVKALAEGKWSAGLHVSGLKEGAVGYSVENSNVLVPEKILVQVEDIKQKIISGELVPCSSLDEMANWVSNNQYK